MTRILADAHLLLELDRPNIARADPPLPELIPLGAQGVVPRINRLTGRQGGKCPFPGVPLSVNAPKPGAPVRSVGWRVIIQPNGPPPLVGSPMRLFPPEVIGPLQSPGPPSLIFRATRVLMRIIVASLPFLRPLAAVLRSLVFSVIVLLSRIAVPPFEMDAPPPVSTFRWRAIVVLMTTSVLPFESPQCESLCSPEWGINHSGPKTSVKRS